jgi:signal transduction histidine kinase
MVQAVLGASGAIYLWRYVASAFNAIGTSPYNGAVTVGDVIKLRMDSSNNLTVYQNGVSRVTGIDSTYASNTKHGMGMRNAGTALDRITGPFTITAISAAVPLGFGKLTNNRKYFLPSEAALVLLALESKRRLSRRKFFQWLPGAFWRK